ncbi:Polyketide synthase enoylreductase [Penicillium taxi]|uniref:Polyketide synthase enoylreductase n=1 Tax=Penicillium taxi TaxID=168475 RepID=UPI0025452494|nr:Polyketide synthase enoylreductase [Penicillium taxi]KAJ5885436.1 Polyketide synthase enoylreductase [Penicillium taxi]
MKQAFVDKNLKVEIRNTDIPAPSTSQILIRVVVSGTNPKDWRLATDLPNNPPLNQGDDIAGYVEAVGAGVIGFHIGDRVAAFHEMLALNGSYGEYAIAWEYTTFHIPEKTSFEEAATIPLAAMTAALGVYQILNLPLPWRPTQEPTPLVVYGGASAVGAFAIKLAQLSNIHPLIVVAGKGATFIEGLIDRKKGDTIIDYREGDEAVRKAIKAASDKPIYHAFDAVAEKGSYHNIAVVLTVPAKIASALPIKEKLPEGISHKPTMVNRVHMPPAEGTAIGNREFAMAFYRFFGRGLDQGWFTGHPFEVRPGGLQGLQGALLDLKSGKASAVKYVVRISETD